MNEDYRPPGPSPRFRQFISAYIFGVTAPLTVYLFARLFSIELILQLYWKFAVATLVVGAILAMFGRRREDSTLTWIGTFLFCWFLTSYLLSRFLR